MTVTVTPSPNATDLCDEKCAALDKIDAGRATCSFSSRGRDGAFSLLLALGLLALGWRRRR
jgi:hypothetical protein